SPSYVFIIPNAASHRRIAFSSIASKTGARSPGEELMTPSTSAIALSRASASSRSRCRSAMICCGSAEVLLSGCELICGPHRGIPPGGIIMPERKIGTDRIPCHRPSPCYTIRAGELPAMLLPPVLLWDPRSRQVVRELDRHAARLALYSHRLALGRPQSPERPFSLCRH